MNVSIRLFPACEDMSSGHLLLFMLPSMLPSQSHHLREVSSVATVPLACRLLPSPDLDQSQEGATPCSCSCSPLAHQRSVHHAHASHWLTRSINEVCTITGSTLPSLDKLLNEAASLPSRTPKRARLMGQHSSSDFLVTATNMQQILHHHLTGHTFTNTTFSKLQDLLNVSRFAEDLFIYRSRCTPYTRHSPVPQRIEYLDNPPVRSMFLAVTDFLPAAEGDHEIGDLCLLSSTL